MKKPLIVVTGRTGQVGWELEKAATSYSGEFDFLFTTREELDLHSVESIRIFFQQHTPAYFINCAAYTAVDKAETDRELAMAINADAVKAIAMACAEYGTVLIQLSTDYVFNGIAQTPYQPDEPTDPVNYYGFTKWKGEQAALQYNPKTIVVRTSWVFSAHGNNFVKTMLRLMKERPQLKVVSDQQGCPTYAADLAAALLQMISQLSKGNVHFGIYHFSNTGVTTWYDFAVAIRDTAALATDIQPISAASYPTPAKRPKYSVMDIAALGSDFKIVPRSWQSALTACMHLLIHP
jgi:dTDP-4-dehydrorhamnose reductase